MKKRNLTRRGFLAGSTLAALGTTVPSFNILRAGVSPNEKIRFASIGMGKRACQLTASVYAHPDIDPLIQRVAFCDPWDSAGYWSWGKPYREKVDKDYAKVPWHKDYRRMFDKIETDIDVVIVCGVSNFLYPAAMHAMQRGKHVSITKPMCCTIQEARNLAKAVERYNIVTQWHRQRGRLGHTDPSP